MKASFCYRDNVLEQLVYRQDTENEVLPDKFFSFQYNGQDLNSGMLEYRVVAEQQKAGFRQLELLYDIDPGVLRLRVKVRIYSDFPVIEYFPFFENYGNLPSGLVENFNALDFSVSLTQSYYGKMVIKDWTPEACGRVKIRYHLGSNCHPTDFFPQEKVLYPRFGSNELTLSTVEGRSSVSFMPFFGIDLDDNTGYNVGVGWSGGWRMTSTVNIDPALAVPCGTEFRTTISMLKTCFKVFPGESLRQVGAFIQFRKGMSLRAAQNVHRRFMIKHHAPYDSHGQLIKPPLALGVWGGLESAGIIDRINIAKQHNLPYEVCWVDAGWTGKDAPCPHFCEDSPIKSDWYNRMGQWRINRHVHPDGLRPIADAAHAAGMKLMAWFEPERISAASESPVLTEHPEWLLPCRENQNNFLLDLGNSEALNWITGIITGYLRSEKIDHFRQDFNINPLPFWEENDTPDRMGVHEMKHIDGLYRFWDAIRTEFPGLYIDNCASGGRRLDFVLADYGFPLCQSDYPTFSSYRYTCVQLENYYLDDIYPLHAGLTWLPEGDLYAALSGAGTGIGSKVWQFNGRYPGQDHDFELHRRTLEVIARLRDIKISGDYYPLSENADELENWCAYQVHVPGSHHGCVVYFRRTESPDAVKHFHLHDIDLDRTYVLEFLDGHTEFVQGRDLGDVSLELDTSRSVGVIFYRTNE